MYDRLDELGHIAPKWGSRTLIGDRALGGHRNKDLM